MRLGPVACWPVARCPLPVARCPLPVARCLWHEWHSVKGADRGFWKLWSIWARLARGGVPMQTLLVSVGCEGALGLLPCRVAGNPGRHSPRLACPWATLCRPFRAQEGAGRKVANMKNARHILSKRKTGMVQAQAALVPRAMIRVARRMGAGMTKSE